MTIPGFVASLVDAVVRVCDPEEVVLFGSYAKGMNNRHSDVDLVLVCAEPPTWAARREMVETTSRLAVHVDVHVLTHDEAEAARADPPSFYGCALSGVVVYSREGGESRGYCGRDRPVLACD